MKIGILGGTFNPPHIGHFIIAEEVRQKFGLDKIFFIPTNIPPHKDNAGVSADHRLAMLNVALQKDVCFEVKDLEINRGGVSYTVDTVRELRNDYPDDDFFLIVGSDLANQFSTWKYYKELKEEIKIIVAIRRPNPLVEDEKFIVADIVQIDVSSSKIRNMVANGDSIRYLVCEEVEQYIKRHNFYT
ncbi:MAG: nicotinate (nicotinamide) nucleotide adenylyltransferase [Candidatus Omnitrophica bacterium]|nr:nicotinate (nicotinamide) nucleotide adenylyltransferase [Candidatus Omnitrophota bacterium]